MEYGMEFWGYEELPSEDVPDTPEEPVPEESADPASETLEDTPDPSVEELTDPGQSDQDEQGAVSDSIGDLIRQVVDQSYGTMGDYYIADAGCYAFPTEDVFFHFIAEEKRADWTAASNGCYVPVGSLEAYEAYLASGSPEEDEGEQLPPPVTTEDLAGIKETLQAIYGEDAVFYETASLHMQSVEKALEDEQKLFSNILVTSVAVCFFLALFCGAYVADVFWKRMRAG